MGIRFACHVCEKKLNVKQDLAGRRGICPSCSAKFRIPLEDAEKSTPVESSMQVRSEPLSTAVGAAATADNRAGDRGLAVSVAAEVQTGNTPISKKSRSANSSSLLDQDPEATWYVRPPSGGQYGPASSEVLRQWIEEGRVAATALLWRDGWPQWRDASEALPELSVQLPQGNAVTQRNRSTSRSGVSLSTESPAKPSPRLTGEASVGSNRRSRSMRRVMLIGVLSAIAMALVGVLVVVANR